MKTWSLALVALAASTTAVQSAQARPYQDYDEDYLVTCESYKQRTQYCALPIQGRVYIVNQLSRGACIEGETWGVDRRGIWVSGGCRAEFAVEPRRQIAPGPSRPNYNQGEQVVVCESIDHDQTYCPARIRRGVELRYQLSRTECVQGYNWDFDRRGIWVDEGCRAEFVVF
jgi:hypothetical protein